MILFENKYIKVRFNEQFNVFESEWYKEAETMSAVEFKKCIAQFAQNIETRKPKGFLTDSRNGHFTMPPDIQTWHDNDIIPIYIRSGIKKIAFILPPDIFASISLEQTFEEEKAKVLHTRFFEDADEAFQWIRS